MKRIIGVIGVVVLVTGCATNAVTRDIENREELAARNVRVTTNPDVVRGCEFRGNVRGASKNIFGNQSERLEAELVKMTVSRGGNVLFIGQSVNGRSWDGMRQTEGSGEAYLCSVPEAKQ